MADSPLHSFVEQATGESHLRVEHDFGDGFVRLATSEAERRQAAQDIQNNESVILELLRNSRDAHARNIFVATWRDGEKRRICVIDDGDGIPAAMHRHVFEPRVTSKLDTSHMDAWGLHGRGMALYSISVHADEARVCASEHGLGCSIGVITDQSRLTERRDQSSFPTFEKAEDDTVNVRGPRNILRSVCEFAIESRNACSVTIGSASEIAASLYEHGMATLSDVERIFSETEDLVVTKRLASVGAKEDFAQIARSLGLDLSERTASRILEGQIIGIEPILDRIQISEGNRRKNRPKSSHAKMSRPIKFSREDLAAFSDSVRGSFADMAGRYYLEESVAPSLTQKSGRLIISIPLARKP